MIYKTIDAASAPVTSSAVPLSNVWGGKDVDVFLTTTVAVTGSCTVLVEGRFDNSEQWVLLETLTYAAPRKRVPAMPQMRTRMTAWTTAVPTSAWLVD